MIRAALAFALVSCGERAPTPPAAAAKPPDAGAPCTHDRECVGGWSPSAPIPRAGDLQTRPVCGPVDRCVDGRCRVPPAMSGIASSQTGRLVFDTAGGERTFQVEVVRDAFQTMRGLMCRASMQTGWGMLFVMRARRPQSFWMKNTLIPLDMVFVDDDWSVVGVVRAEPLHLTGHGVAAPSRYVVELNAGEASAAGITKGTRMRFVPGS